MPQLFHPVYRHLWYLSGLALSGLLVLGFAYEKLSGNTSGLAILGFTAAVVHASAWWFTIGLSSPINKIIACGVLFAGALLSSFTGRLAFLMITEQPVETLFENMKFIASVIPVWWLALAVINGVAKEAMRLRLNYEGLPISPRTSLADLFQLTAIVGAILAFSSPAVFSLDDPDYASIFFASLVLNAAVMIPLSLLILRTGMKRKSGAFLKLLTGAVVGCLVFLALSPMFAEGLKEISDLAVGAVTLTVPYLLMLLLARENGLSLTSGWFEEGLAH